MAYTGARGLTPTILIQPASYKLHRIVVTPIIITIVIIDIYDTNHLHVLTPTTRNLHVYVATCVHDTHNIYVIIIDIDVNGWYAVIACGWW